MDSPSPFTIHIMHSISTTESNTAFLDILWPELIKILMFL